MPEKSKTKEQLLKELAELRQRFAELKKSEAELRRMEQRYQDIIEKGKDIIYTLDAKGNITFVNPAVEKILGYKPHELVGKHFMVLIPKELQKKTGADFKKLLKTGEITTETVLLDKEGRPHFIEYSSTVIKEDHRVVGTRGIVRDISRHKRVEEELRTHREHLEELAKERTAQLRKINKQLQRDITQRKKAEEELRESERRYRELWDNAPVAYHTLDRQGIITTVNETEAKMLGYKPKEMVGKSIFEFVLPSQRAEARKRFKQKISSKRIPMTQNRIYVRRDGSKIYVSIHDILECNAEGKVTGVRTTMVDTTERKKAEEALRESEERYRGLVENVTDIIFTLDSQGCFTYISPAVKQISGYTVEELTGQSLTHFVYPADIPEVQAHLKQSFAGEVEPCEFRIMDKDGTIHHIRMSSRLLVENGKAIGLNGIITDITQRKQLEESIRQLAYYDSVTSLPNRVLFNDRFNVALAHARRENGKLVVMLFDLDYFKDVNDKLGHSVGDRLLKGVADRMLALIRQSDTVARMGGDEFMVLLPEIVQPKDSSQVANKILEAVRKPFHIDNHTLHITTSIGIALYPGNGEDADVLMKNADIAMYYVKAHGRNNYKHYRRSMNDKTQN